MKKLFFLLVIAFAGKFCCAQTQAEIEKKMKETQQQIDKIKNDPKYKELMKSMSNLDSLKKNMSHGTITTIPKTKVNDTVSTAFPVVNNLLLQALPLRVFNKAELISYLHNLNSKLTTLLHTSYGTDINTIAPETIHLSGTSIAFWLSGKPYESALIALKAAEMSPDNIVLLNNTGGILASSGLSVNAIPVLEYANQHLPGNNMILNNLGQAYFSLGDLKKAEKYLLESVSTAIYYPDANLTLAYIYNKKGDKGNAIRYAENSLRGAYSADAEYLLLKLNPAAKLMDYIRHRYKQPEFFNYHKYPLLPQCVKVSQASTLKPQYDAYAQMLWDLDAKYRELAKQENDIAKKTVPDIMTKAIKEQRSPYRPFGYFGIAVLAALNKEYGDKFIRYDTYKKNFEDSIKILDTIYARGMKAIADKWGELTDDMETGSVADQAASKSICSERNELGNALLPKYASLREDFQLETIKLYSNYLNDWGYWSYIASVDDHSYRVAFYGLVSTMIHTLKEINQTKFIFPCRGPGKGQKEKAGVLDIEEPSCFFKPKIVLPLGGVNLEISCEGYKLEAGEGLIGKIEYSLQSGDVTVAFGVGAKTPKLSFGAGGVDLGAEAEAKSQFFITFNKGVATDCGVLWETEIKAKIGVGEVETTVGVEEGLTAGFGSGLNMKDNGPIKSFLGQLYPVQPDAKQINKNIPLYRK